MLLSSFLSCLTNLSSNTAAKSSSLLARADKASSPTIATRHRKSRTSA